MNVFKNWWETGDLGELGTTVYLDRKSLVVLAVISIVTATLIILIAKSIKNK